MRIPFLVLCLSLSAPARAQAFDLSQSDGKVCKTSPGKPDKTCYIYLNAENLGVPEFPDSVEVMDHLKALNDLVAAAPGGVLKSLEVSDLDRVGSALLLSPAHRDLLSAHFQRLSVRDIALDIPHLTQAADGTVTVSFFANVYWIGNSAIPMQGTVGVQGVLTMHGILPQDLKRPASLLSFGNEFNEYLTQMFAVHAVSDTTTEVRIETLRHLEYLARAVEIRQIYGPDMDVDAGTIRLLQESIGPAVLAQLFYVPLAKSLIHDLQNQIPGMDAPTLPNILPK